MLQPPANFEYWIEFQLLAIEKEPGNLAHHQQLRDVGLRRKAAGGASLGMFETMKAKRDSIEPIDAMLKAERAMAYDPVNADLMLLLMERAAAAGLGDVAAWARELMRKANGN